MNLYKPVPADISCCFWIYGDVLYVDITYSVETETIILKKHIVWKDEIKDYTVYISIHHQKEHI